MKYIEPFKSFLLLFLVCLSLVLTVMIWNYKPNHQFFEDTQVEDVLISESKSMTDILKPYRSILRTENVFRGTSSVTYMDSIFTYFESIKATDLTLVNNRLTVEQMNDLMRMDQRISMYFYSEVPLQSFTKVLNFESVDLPEITFDRIIIDLNDLSRERELNILFLNTSNQTLYRTSILNQSENKLKELFLADAENFTVFEEVTRPNLPSLFVSDEKIEAVKYMYYIDYINDIPIELFKKALFQNENIVKNIRESDVTELYMDNTSSMKVDTKNRILNYVYRYSGTLPDVTASKLLNDTYNYINDHGGFNADYRLAVIKPVEHIVEYQLFFQGYPVFSYSTTTKLSTTWGDSQIHEYKRPYYALEMDIPSEMKIKELYSSKEMLQHYVKEVENVKDIVRGYYLDQKIELGVFELEPAWFVLRDYGWERIKIDNTGGMANGLE